MFSFLSIEFILLFFVFFVVYWLFRKRPDIQNDILLMISYLIIYLTAGPIAVSALFVFSVFVFFVANKIISGEYQKVWLVLGIVMTLANLSLFKYYDFFRENISQVLQFWHLDSTNLMANIVFPLGISYYSFQAISYLVSLYRQTSHHHDMDCDEVKRLSFWQTLSYFSFFATISAGPIARIYGAKNLKDIKGDDCGMYEQLNNDKPRHLLYPKIALTLIVLALAKKWWLAGYLADNWVDPVFANPTGFHSLEVLTAIYGYTLQLFLDFSGYSEMMLAFGLLLGFRLPVNFNSPLLAHNIREFWDRWHISLSTWIRDYIYIPLGGSRKGFLLTQINLIVAMVLSGIWHGSTWNFFFWGLLHALAITLLNIGDLICQKISGRDGERNFLAHVGMSGRIIGVVITVHFVVFAFVFFRATTLNEALLIFKALTFNHKNVLWANNPLYLLTVLLMAWLIYPLFYHHKFGIGKMINKMPNILFYILCFLMFMIVVVFAPSGIPGFIYANF